jgi:hypothetical protein
MKFIAAFLALACTVANATRIGPDLTDLWWDPAHPGWAIAVTQEDDTIFATVLVYNGEPQADGSATATWYFASDMKPVDSNDSEVFAYEGALYRADGPRFSLGASKLAPAVRPVGTLRLAVDTWYSGEYWIDATYSIDGAQVSATLWPMTLKSSLPESADYYILQTGKWIGCANGAAVYTPASLAMRRTAAGLQINTYDASGLTCAMTGTSQLATRNGWIRGAIACGDDTPYGVEPAFRGTFVLQRAHVDPQRIAMAYSIYVGGDYIANGTCRIEGEITGVRVAR